MQNNVQISGKWSKSKPKVDFQYGGRLFLNSIASIWASYIALSSWWPRPLKTISGVAFVDIAAFRRSKFMSKPNFVDVTQLMAEI